MRGRGRGARVARRLGQVEVWQWIAAATMAALAAMTTRELADGVVPFGDNSMIEVRSRDVFSRHPPMVNMLSTVADDLSVRHPGPLLFDLLALPVRVGRHGRGLLGGVALIHCAVVWTAARTARRFLGPSATAGVACVTALLVWSLGREILTEPWQPHIALPSFLLLLVAGWGVAVGCDRCAIAAAFAFSFVLQTHASYLVVAPAVVVAAVVARFTLARRTTVDRRLLFVALATTVVLWIQPIAQQFFGSGRGNLGAIVRVAASDGTPVLGLDQALRSITAVIAKPPFWLRPGVFGPLPTAERGLGDEIASAAAESGLVLPLARVGLIAVMLVAFGLWGRHDRVVMGGVAIIASVLVAATAFVARLPVDAIFGFTVHKVRWLWPLGAFTVMFLGATALSRLRRARASAAEGLLAITAVVALVAACTSERGTASTAERFGPVVTAAADVRESLSRVEDVGTVYIAFEHETVLDAFIETSIVAELVERGVAVRLTLPLAIAQYGDHYRLDAGASVTLRVDVVPRAAATIGDVVYEGRLDLDPQLRELFVEGTAEEELVLRVVLEPFDWSHTPG